VQIAITTRHGNINATVQETIRRKSEKLLTFFERITAIGVTVDFEADRVKIEILVDAEHKHNFVAQEVGELGEDVLTTFDRTLPKMEQQLRKYKQKVQDHRRDRPLNELAGDGLSDEEQPQQVK